MGTDGKTKYMCSNAICNLDRGVQTHESSLVIAFIFSVKQKGGHQARVTMVYWWKEKNNVLKTAMRSKEDSFFTVRL